MDALKSTVNMARNALGMPGKKFDKATKDELEEHLRRLGVLEAYMIRDPEAVKDMKPAEIAKVFNLDRQDADAFKRNVLDNLY